MGLGWCVHSLLVQTATDVVAAEEMRLHPSRMEGQKTEMGGSITRIQTGRP
jgi:hypothetical protein